MQWKSTGNVPVFLQMEAVECGAACLGMVLAHFGRWESMEQLRNECSVSRDGVSAGNIARAATRFGLQVKGFKLETSQLKRLPFPQIVFWNFNHFMVIEHISDTTVYAIDPALGRRQLTYGEFDSGFTGITLCFEPSENFVRKGSKPSLAKEFLARMASSRASLTLVVLIGILVAIPGIIIPSFSRVFIDYYLVERYESWLDWLLWAMLAMAVMVSAITSLQQSLLLKLTTKLSITGAGETLWRLLHLPINYFMQRTTGEVGGRIMLSDEVAAVITGPALNIVTGSIQSFIYLAVMTTYNLRLTLITCALAAVNVLLQYRAALKLQGASQHLELEQGKYDSTTLQGLTLLEFYKASGLENLLFGRNIGAHARLLNAEQLLGRTQRSVAVLPGFLSSLLALVILFVGALEVMAGSFTIGMFVAYQALARLLMGPLNQIVASFASLNTVSGTFVRVNDVYRTAKSWEFEGTRQAGEISGSCALSVRGLTYGFSPDAPPVLSDLNIDIPAGSLVALVGVSGSGKSTLARLVAGLFDPPPGAIFIDNTDILDFNREKLRDAVVLVEQESLIFEGTVSENLTVWDNTVPAADLVEVCQATGIHEDITMRTGAYQSRLADRGGDMSGGQQQRLATARGLLWQPSLLILDEATAALDTESESKILKGLRATGATVVMVSHRLSAVRDCDRIIVLDQGQVAEEGTHDELIARRGLYRQAMDTLNH